jgi:tRNA (guanine-N7-)-methyltransferase
VRQHVNPLGLGYVEPRATPVVRPAALPAACPVEVELGCADGQFSFQLAAACPDTFVVGLDIRERVIERNVERARDRPNLGFGYVNLNVDLDRVFEPGSVTRFHVLFPDPWFKAKHHKRRVFEPGLLQAIHHQLVPGGELHIASDVYEVALAGMAEVEETVGTAFAFTNFGGPWSFWRGNPFAGQSRREDTTLRRGQRVWRMRYRRA